MHGTEGEDGSLQTLLEERHVQFTGSNSRSSRACFDKKLAKKIVEAAGISVAAGFTFLPIEIKSSGIDFSSTLIENFEKYGKLIAKPVASGSSFGLHFLQTKEDCIQFSETCKTDALLSYGEYLVEQLCVGRELTVGITERIGATDAERTFIALPPSEVIMQSGRNFDYEGKYLGQGSTEVTPAKLTQKETELCQGLALKAHQVLQCSGYSRTDMILTAAGPIFLETNTLPGLSKASFIPQQLHAAAISMETFLHEQLQIAQKRI